MAQDYLVARAGGERVALVMADDLHAPLVTSLYAPDRTFAIPPGVSVRPLATNRIPWLRTHHRAALPILAPAWLGHRIDADVTICASAGWSHMVRCTGRKVVYWYSPAKWLHAHDRYLAAGMRGASAALRVLSPLLRAADRRGALDADVHVAISSAIRDQLRDVFGVEATVINSPVSMDAAGSRAPVAGVEPGYLLCVCRLLPYKHVREVVEAARLLPTQRLVVLGEGPLRAQLQAVAPANVTFVSNLTDEQVRWLYANSQLLISAAEEDYGLTPLEAGCFGVPSVVRRWGGFLDTVIDERTGLFFDTSSAEDIAQAVSNALHRQWSSETIKAHAQSFGPERFMRRLRAASGLAPY